MLIGPTVTLATLEKAISMKRVELKQKENEAISEAEELKQVLRTAPMRTTNGEGMLVSNPEYVKAFDEFEVKRKTVVELQIHESELKKKADELEVVEDEAKSVGKHYVKAEERITLSLKEAVYYGVTQEMIEADSIKKGIE